LFTHRQALVRQPNQPIGDVVRGVGYPEFFSRPWITASTAPGALRPSSFVVPMSRQFNPKSNDKVAHGKLVLYLPCGDYGHLPSRRRLSQVLASSSSPLLMMSFAFMRVPLVIAT